MRDPPWGHEKVAGAFYCPHSKTLNLLSPQLAGSPRGLFVWKIMNVYLKPAEAAEYLRSSVSTLSKARRSGKGPTFVRLGRSIRYRVPDLDSWMASSAGTAISLYDPICKPREANG